MVSEKRPMVAGKAARDSRRDAVECGFLVEWCLA